MKKIFKKIISDLLMFTILPEFFIKFNSNKIDKESNKNISKYANWVINIVEKIGE